MTLDTQVVDRLSVNEMLVLSAVSAVTTQAVQSQVWVARVDHLFPDRVSRVGLPVVTLSAEFDIRLFG